MLELIVSGVGVFYFVLILVFRISLKCENVYYVRNLSQQVYFTTIAHHHYIYHVIEMD